MINLKDAGVKKGQCVAFHGENQELHLYLFLVSWMMNFLYMPLDFKAPLSRPASERHCDFLITEKDLPAADPRILRPADVMQDNISLPEEFCPRAIPFRREASVIFTSGSTGKPRGLVHTVGNYIYSAMGTNEFIGLTSADRWLISLPLFHVGGVLIWLRTLLAGSASILPASLKNIDRAIAMHRPSVLSLVPAQLIRLVDNPEMVETCKSCKAILLGGAPTPAWLIDKALDSGLPVIPSYGSTEGCAQITGVNIGSPRSAYTTAGRPLSYRDIRIDSDGSIMLGGKTLFKRCIEENKSSHIRADSYFKTADAGRIDVNGNLVCLGRTDGVFISGGENIQPFEIENHLLAMENIAEAFVVPVDHREFGKVPWAFVVTEAPFNEELIIAALRKMLPGYKIPKRIIRLDSREKKGKMKYKRSELTALAAKMVNLKEQPGKRPVGKTILNFTSCGSKKNETIVFLHGFMGDNQSLSLLMMPLADRYRCIAFDLPGHGKSIFQTIDPFIKISTMEDVARLILRDLDTLGVERFSLYGYSMGGRIAQNMAILMPQRLTRLIMESASFGIEDADGRRARYERDMNLLSGIKTKADFAAFLADWHNLPLFQTLPGTPHYQRLIDEKLANDIPELSRALQIMSVGHHPFWAESLSHLSIPVFYFCGEKDEAYSSTAVYIKKLLPGLRVTVFKNASHNIHAQYPEAIVHCLKEALEFSECGGKTPL